MLTTFTGKFMQVVNGLYLEAPIYQGNTGDLFPNEVGKLDLKESLIMSHLKDHNCCFVYLLPSRAKRKHVTGIKTMAVIPRTVLSVLVVEWRGIMPPSTMSS